MVNPGRCHFLSQPRSGSEGSAVFFFRTKKQELAARSRGDLRGFLMYYSLLHSVLFPVTLARKLSHFISSPFWLRVKKERRKWGRQHRLSLATGWVPEVQTPFSLVSILVHTCWGFADLFRVLDHSCLQRTSVCLDEQREILGSLLRVPVQWASAGQESGNSLQFGFSIFQPVCFQPFQHWWPPLLESGLHQITQFLPERMTSSGFWLCTLPFGIPWLSLTSSFLSVIHP